MGFADLHIHSIYSQDGTGTIPAILKYIADHTLLNVIAITDHDSMAGVREAIEVVPGCEISTSDGHLLALYINKGIKSGYSLADTALMVADQGGIAVAAHPMARGTSSLKINTIWRALEKPGVAKSLIGVEVFNGGLVYTRTNPEVARQVRELPLAALGNSDAHVLPMIGRGSTWFEGNTAADLRTALMQQDTIPQVGRGLDGLDVIKTYLPRYILKKMGWAAWNANPQEKIKYIRYAKVLNQQHAY